MLQVANALVSNVPRRVLRVPVVVVNVSVVDSNAVTLSDKVVMSDVQDEGQVSREYVVWIASRATESILPSKELILPSISSSCLRWLANWDVVARYAKLPIPKAMIPPHPRTN